MELTSDLDPSPEHNRDSTTPLDDWEVEQSDQAINKQLEERFKQVRILQREKADKDARLEKAKQEEAISKSARSDPTESTSIPAPFVPPVKMQILRRPKSDAQLEEAAKGSREQEEKERSQKKAKTLEEKQAAYDEARSRILGSDYKPETAPAPQPSTSPVASRNRSPEQIRVRRPSPEAMYMQQQPPPQPVYHQQPPPQPYPQHCGYSQAMPPMSYAVPHQIGCFQSYMPFAIDTSRPPPLMSQQLAGPSFPPPPQPSSSSQGPVTTYATGQYFGGPANGQYMPPAPHPSSVPYGRPPMALYAPGTLGAAMQVVDSAQNQAQRKNRHNKKKNRGEDLVH